MYSNIGLNDVLFYHVPYFSDAQRQLLKTKDALIEMESQANNTNNDQIIAQHLVQLDTVSENQDFFYFILYLVGNSVCSCF